MTPPYRDKNHDSSDFVLEESDRLLLTRLDERLVYSTKYIETEVKKLESAIRDNMKEHKESIRDLKGNIEAFEKKYVTKDEFEPVKRFIYASLTLVSSAIFAVLVSWINNTPKP